jgi:hypothetical protein
MTRNPNYKLRAASFVTLPLKGATFRVAPQRKVAGDHESHQFSGGYRRFVPVHNPAEVFRIASWNWSQRVRFLLRARLGSSPTDTSTNPRSRLRRVGRFLTVR